MDERDRWGFEIGEEELAAGTAERDRSHEFPTDLINELAALGGMAMKTAPKDDGPGVGNLGYALAVETISRSDASVGVVMVASNLAAAIIAQNASDAQRETFVKAAARGELGALFFALTEPGTGSDAAAIRTTARRDGDGWVLNGAKQWITGASRAKPFLVFARLPDKGDQATAAFLVEAPPGFTLGRVEDKMGLTSSGTAMLHFDQVRLPADPLLGTPGQGLRMALHGIAPSRIAITAQSIGIAERALQLGRDYARQRNAFWSAHRGVPEHPIHAGRRAAATGSGVAVDAARCDLAGQGHPDPRRGLDGQTGRVGNLRADRRCNAATSRRQRLFARLRDRAPLS